MLGIGPSLYGKNCVCGGGGVIRYRLNQYSSYGYTVDLLKIQYL